jgi:predicted DNA-binding protein (MmcQ/YjbR family)
MSKLEAFDCQEPPQPTEEQRAELMDLGRQLKNVWFSEKTDARLKKQIVRTLIRHVFAELDESTDEAILWVEWSGGQITELRQKRRSRRPRTTPSRLAGVIGMLRKVSDDAGIARMLNRSGVRTERGETWTKRRVLQFRKRHDIAAFNAKEKRQQGWMLQSEAATSLKISPMSVHRLIQHGILPAEHFPGLPSVIKSSDLGQEQVQQAILAIRRRGNSPLPADPKQLSLFPVTKSQKGAS